MGEGVRKVADISRNIIKKCKEGDFEAYSQLYARYERYLYSLCYSYLYHNEDVFDVIQEIYIKIFRNIDKYDEKKEFTPWLRQIAVNTCLNYKRDTSKKKNLSLDYEEDAGRSYYENTASDINVEEQIVNITTREAIRACLQNLPPRQKMIITLHYFEGLSYHEMAKILDQPLGTVKNSLFRARKLLKDVMQEKGLLEV